MWLIVEAALAALLGWIDSTERWIEIRSLRNWLVHEYMDSASDLLQALLVALESVELLTSYQQLMATYAKKYLISKNLPPGLFSYAEG